LVAAAGRTDSSPPNSFDTQTPNWQSELFATSLVDQCRAYDGSPRRLMARTKQLTQAN